MDDEPFSEVKTYPTLSQANIPVPEKYVDIPTLQAEANTDIYSWIYIPDTGIDYAGEAFQESFRMFRAPCGLVIVECDGTRCVALAAPVYPHVAVGSGLAAS